VGYSRAYDQSGKKILPIRYSGSKSTGVEKIKLNANWDDFLIPLSKWTLNLCFTGLNV
jgi:hypothetical protein